MKKLLLASLIASTALVAPAAQAQDSEVAALRAQIEELQAQIALMSGRLDQMEQTAEVAQAAPVVVAAPPAPAPAATPAPAPAAAVAAAAEGRVVVAVLMSVNSTLRPAPRNGASRSSGPSGRAASPGSRGAPVPRCGPAHPG